MNYENINCILFWRKQMKRSLLWVGLFWGLFSSMSAQASSGWYIGGAYGQSSATGSSSFSDALAAQGITAQSATACQCNSGKLYAGLALANIYALEFGYVNLGTRKLSGAFTAPLPGGSFTNDIGITAYTLDIIGKLPLSYSVAAYGRLGVARTTVSSNIIATTALYGFSSPSRVTENHTHLGVGVNFELMPGIDIRGELEFFNKLGDPATTGQSDILLYSVGMNYGF
ncbi:MAG: hypothetical protein EPO42_02380 [Gallionellaceae bacterium]|nr:MAG: hypothetical protein EPO42_02380 [Gallionellaceae bacterium]